MKLGSLLLIFVMPILAAETMVPPYPQIVVLSVAKDPLFKQQQELVEQAGVALAAKELPGDLSLFRYQVVAGDNLFSLASRFNLPYEALATLNHLASAEVVTAGRWLLVPSQPGVFMATQEPAELDRLMAGWRDASQGKPLKIVRDGKPQALTFFPGERFHAVERAFFLGILFRFPLPAARLTSPFGSRLNPFSGHPSFHNGVDLAAPTGTEVQAARDGVVKEAGSDHVLGNFVRLDHGDGYETVYGHLSKITVSLNSKVLSGTIVGKVGSTGLSTGPHLHFEIRRQGSPQDPVSYLPTRP